MFVDKSEFHPRLAQRIFETMAVHRDPLNTAVLFSPERMQTVSPSHPEFLEKVSTKMQREVQADEIERSAVVLDKFGLVRLKNKGFYRSSLGSSEMRALIVYYTILLGEVKAQMKNQAEKLMGVESSKLAFKDFYPS